ncbi:hypothetical protein [Paraherbaspirillum soli]|uniref:Uncharacterized protein n=1 Tax=Paraherbaspirillum soli TaxID=631222 RepID=A0ABW0MD50_9BURK
MKTMSMALVLTGLMAVQEPNDEQDQDYERKRNDELRLLYTSCVSEIASFKQQQWHVANYGLLLYAAIASMPKFVAAKMTELELFLSYVGTFAVLAAGWYLVGLLASSIQERRRRLTKVRTHFTSEFMNAWRAGRLESEVPDLPQEKPDLLWFFRTVFVVGFGVTLFLLTKFSCAA